MADNGPVTSNHRSGQPEGQRLLQGPGFPGDTGEATPALAAALAAYADGTGSDAEVVAALGASRLLVPVVAVLGEVEYDDQGLAHDKTSDMATVLLTGADGRQALLAFTSMDTLRHWRPDARPVPVLARDAARAAIQDGAQAVVIDLAGPVRFVLQGDDLEGIAREWTLARVATPDGGTAPAWIRPTAE